MTVLFGPAGNSNSFAKVSKASKDAPKWLNQLGLTSYEYQCGRGVNVGEETARKIGEEGKKYGIAISLHAPYFINLSSIEEEKIEKNIKYVLESAKCVDYMQGKRIVIHMGGLSKLDRKNALINTKENINHILGALDKEGLSHIIPCIETMGKVNVMGTLEEVMEICKLDERLLPCIDFGHLNARTHGGLKSYEDFENIFDTMENEIGVERARKFHSHFSKIEFSKGGEVRHLTFEDDKFGPDFKYVAELLAKRDYESVFICESAGTQAEDALKMQAEYFHNCSFK